MSLFISLAGGLLFGLGLIVSGMSDPGKVIGFLNFTGVWDSSLAWVMAGAIAIGLFAFRLAGRRSISLLGEPMQLPAVRYIDTRLVAGSAIFGVGWGLAGICPGPGLVLLGLESHGGSIFVLAMLLGMGLFELADKLRQGFFLH